MTAPRADLAQGRTVAYFSMEVGLESGLPTYSGGLGVLAGDTLKAAADLRVPMLGITLLHRKGYFRQKLDDAGEQEAGPQDWSPKDWLDPVPTRASIRIGGRTVRLAAWRKGVEGSGGHVVPVYFLDTDLEENAEEDRALTDHLYGGDERYRLRQEAVLGLGGLALLRSLGYERSVVHHMNEGHAALLTIGLLLERVGRGRLASATSLDEGSVRRRCVFTTHTPVEAGHDQFDRELVVDVLGEEVADHLETMGCSPGGRLNMTLLGLNLSRFANGVAMRHGQVSRSMFPGFPIAAITNGVHAQTWTSAPFQDLFDERLPRWRLEADSLRHAVGIPTSEIRAAHGSAKTALLAEVKKRTGRELAGDALTIGFARRATPYKRADLLFDELEELRAIAARTGPMQLVFAGKAQPLDEGGRAVIRRIFEASRELGQDLPVVYLEGYDMDLGGLLTSGVDVWLNTPEKPREASGTSGMKAALNGVPSLSSLDGWWIEGHVEGVTGWSFGGAMDAPPDRPSEVADLLRVLEGKVAPLYHGDCEGFGEVQRSAIALNGSYFNAQRMVQQYVRSSYHLAYAP